MRVWFLVRCVFRDWELCMQNWNLAPSGPNLIHSPGIAAHMMMNHQMNNHLNISVLMIRLLWLTVVREMVHIFLMQCWVTCLTLLLLIQASMILSCTISVFKWDNCPCHSFERNSSFQHVRSRMPKQIHPES